MIKEIRGEGLTDYYKERNIWMKGHEQTNINKYILVNQHSIIRVNY